MAPLSLCKMTLQTLSTFPGMKCPYFTASAQKNNKTNAIETQTWQKDMKSIAKGNGQHWIHNHRKGNAATFYYPPGGMNDINKCKMDVRVSGLTFKNKYVYFSSHWYETYSCIFNYTCCVYVYIYIYYVYCVSTVYACACMYLGTHSYKAVWLNHLSVHMPMIVCIGAIWRAKANCTHHSDMLGLIIPNYGKYVYFFRTYMCNIHEYRISVFLFLRTVYIYIYMCTIYIP